MKRPIAAFRCGTAYRLVLMRMAKRHSWQTFAEVGVRLGHTGVFLLSNLRGLSYAGVDPFLAPEGSHDESGFSDYGQPDMEDWYRRAKRSLNGFGPRATLLRATSVDAAAQLLQESGGKPLFDCVFIDGDHRTEHVLADIDAWRPLVKPGGWLIGHDWDWSSVRAAVQLRFEKPVPIGANLWAVQQ